jgi:hypothetical protein
LAFVHERDRQVHFKIVYAGPALGGKTTNLLALYERLPVEKRGRLLSIAGLDERTLFFDLLPLHLGTVRGFETRFHLYTVPGQPRHVASRRAILRGADVVVFVADSSPARSAAVEEAWCELEEPAFAERSVPRVVQFNKRDLPDALPLGELRPLVGGPGRDEVEAVATEGEGVYETLRLACRAALAHFAPREMAEPVGGSGPP